jgi:hypothetical protein
MYCCSVKLWARIRETSVDLPLQTAELSVHKAHAEVLKAIMLAEFSLRVGLLLKSLSALLQISRFGYWGKP